MLVVSQMLGEKPSMKPDTKWQRVCKSKKVCPAPFEPQVRTSSLVNPALT